MTLKTKILNLFRVVFQLPGLEGMIRTLASGKSTNSFWAKLVPNNYQYGLNSTRVFTYKGVKLRANIRDYVGHYLYFGFQDEGQEVLLDLAKPGSYVLDIGTNIGSTLLLFADKIGEKGKVFGFEPDPENFENCRYNLSLNNFSNAQVENIGLGDIAGEFDMVVDTETNRGGNRISTNVGESLSRKIQVKTLDSWFTAASVPQLDLIKIDVEGYDYKVLYGGKEVLKKYKPLLFVELDDKNLRAVGDSASKLIAFLEELGYEVFHSINGQRLNKNDSFENCHYDILAK